MGAVKPVQPPALPSVPTSPPATSGQAAEAAGCTSDRKLTRGNLDNTLNYFGKEYRVSVDVLIRSIKTATWQSILHLTTGGDQEKYGRRTPAIWVNANGKLHICSAINGISNYIWDTKSALPLNDCATIVVEQ